MAALALDRGALVVWTPPHPTETSRSWLLRLCDVNRFPSPRWITGRTTRVSAAEDMATAMKVAGVMPTCGDVEPDIMTAAWPPHSTVPIRFRRLERPLVCPACLAERAMCPAEWELLYFTACPRHGCDLVGTCPQGHPLSWDRRAVCACARRLCDADLRNTPLTIAPEQEVAFASTLASAGSASGGLKVLRGATLVECMGVVRLFGDISTIRPGYPPNRHLKDPKAVVRAVAALLDGWPETFRPWLSAMASPGDDVAAARRLHAQVNRMEPRGRLPSSLAESIRTEIHRLFFDEPEGHVAPQRGMATVDLSVRDAAASMGVKEFELAVLIDEGRIRTVARVGRGNGLRIPETEVRRFVQGGRDPPEGSGPRLAFISLPQAAKLLGIGTKLVGAMLDARLLGEVSTGRGRKVVRSSIHDLLQQLDGVSVAPEAGGERHWEAWDALTRRGTCAGLARLLSAGLNGDAQVRHVAGPHRGLRAFEFAIRNRPVPSTGLDVIGTRELRKLLRCQQRDPARLLACGALLVDAGGRRNTRGKRAGFDSASVTAFDQVCASTARLAAENGLTTRALREALLRSGIKPMLAEGKDGAAFWNRSEVAVTVERLVGTR